MGKEKQFIDHRRQRLMRVSWGLILLIIAILAIACVSFYMFTATLSSPRQMTLYLPEESGKDSVDKYNGVKKKLTLILLKEEKVFGYYGDFIKGGRSVSVSEIIKISLMMLIKKFSWWRIFYVFIFTLIIIVRPFTQQSHQKHHNSYN